MCRGAGRRSVQMCGQCHSDMKFSGYKYFSSYVDEQIFLVYIKIVRKCFRCRKTKQLKQSFESGSHVPVEQSSL